MKLPELECLLLESGMTAEQLGDEVGFSGMTVRRWIAQPEPDFEIPQLYRRGIVGAIFRMIEDGRLATDSRSARFAINATESSPQRASVRIMTDAPAEAREISNFEESILNFLSRIGQKKGRQAHVNKHSGRLLKFEKMGRDWRTRIRNIIEVSRSVKRPLFDRTIALGALFYLLQVFDLIPDAIPVVGYIDDFGVLMIASSYFTKRAEEK